MNIDTILVETRIQVIPELPGLENNGDNKTPIQKGNGKNNVAVKNIAPETEYYRTVVETLRDIIWTTDMELRFTYLSPAVEEMLGYTVQETLMKSINHIMTPESISMMVNIFAIALDDETTPNEGPDPPIEVQLICKDGSSKWVEISRTFLRNDEGTPTGILGVARDISRRKSAEEVLRESEYKYRALIEQSLDGIAIAQPNPTRLVFANRTLGEMLGYSVDELSSLSEEEIQLLIHPDDRRLFFMRFKNRLEGKDEPSQYQVRALRKDGVTIYFELSATRIMFLGEYAVQVTFKNITEIMHVQETLHQNQERYRVLFKESNDAIIVVDLEGKIAEGNPQTSTMLGYTLDELSSLSMWEIIIPDEHEGCKDTMGQLIAGDKVPIYERVFVKKDGTQIPVEMSVSLVQDSAGNPQYFQAIGRDVSERRRSEMEIREREERVQTIMDSLPIGVMLIDMETRHVVYANPAVSMMSGIPTTDFMGSICHDNICPAERGKCPIMDLGQDMDKSERVLPMADGTGLPILKTAIPIVLGDHHYLLEALIDISESKRTQEELTISEARLAEAQRIAKLGSWDWNIVTGEEFWSNEIYEIFGISCETTASYDLFIDSTHPDDREMVRYAIRRALYEDRPYIIDHRIIHSDGFESVVREIGEVFRNEKGEPIRMIGTTQDITDHIKAQEKLKAAQARAEFFTDLMSHDINNLHQGIMIGLELLLFDKDFPFQFQEQVQSALTNLERSVFLIRNVRRFSGISESPIVPIDIREPLVAAEVVIRDSFPFKNVIINFDGKQEYCTVVGNEFIFDLFYNILHNSVKFNPNADVAINIQVGPSEDERIVEIKITDHGPGISNSRKEKILTRFKDRETKGSGLGLAIVQQIVDQYDGKIWIEDRIRGEPKSGTSFIIHFHRA